jgi:hypothetical protein
MDTMDTLKMDINMVLCQNEGMRTTIEIPDGTFREMKALTAQSGVSMKEFVLRAVQERVSKARKARRKRHEVQFPLIRSKNPVAIAPLTNAEIEDLLD